MHPLAPVGRRSPAAAARSWLNQLGPRALLGLMLTVGAHADEPVTTAPLAPRSLPGGTTLFTELASAQTGIVTENRYADPRMWQDRFEEFKFGALGTGVAIGDYDGDGRPDVYVVSKTESSRLFRNLGNWKFEDVTERVGLLESGAPAWRQGAAWADVNNDGRLDLYVCRFAAPNLLYINQGDGTFQEEAASRGLALTDASGQAAFCDYDRDGWLDVYVQTNVLDAKQRPEGQRDRLYHNRGDGTFADVTDHAGIRGETQGHSATWWDRDEDGWPDLYVANDFAPADQLYRNNRDGTFTNVLDRVVPYTPHSSMGADVGDVDNDGHEDLLVADMAATTHEKDQRGMAKIRAMLDTAVEVPGVAPQFMRNALLLGTGTGHMREAAQLAGVAATDWTWSVRFEDFDNDGRLDLHVTNGMVRELHNADLVRDISASDNLAAGVRREKASPVYRERNLAYRNAGDLKFTEVGREWGLAQEGVSLGAATGDLDGDGDLDLVYANYEAGVTVLRNDSAGNRVVIALHGTSSNRFGVGATVRIESALGAQMRTLVSARGYLSTSESIVHFGLGADTTITRLTVAWPSGRQQTFTDLPVNRKLVITEPGGTVVPAPPATRGTRFVGAPLELQAREQPEQENRAQAFLPVRFDRRGPALAVADFTGDGREEVVLGGTTATPLQGAPLTLMPDNLDDGPLLVFDANGDGRPDLLETKAGTSQPPGADYQPKLYLNQPSGFVAGELPATPLSAGAAVAADFDRDGDLDVFLGARVEPGRYPLPPRSALLRNTGGRFEDASSLLPSAGVVGLVTSALWTDVDQDGWPDLLLAQEWGPVTYLHNDKGSGFTDYSERAGFAPAGSGWWTSLATADFNRDGKPDYAVGNVGLNTPYRASPAAPALLYYGRFGDGGPPQLVEAYYEDGKIYPRRSRNELATKITGLMKRFPRHNDYAKATLSEILTEPRLAKAQRFAATELQSGVFLSQPDGTYRFLALPRIAQIAPIQGMVAGDFDGDGLADVCAVQNSHAPTPSSGRFAGGLGQLLIGDGRGNLTPVAPERSGLVVPGDAKALVVADLNDDGWPDLIASRNDEPALAFRNQRRADYRGFRVLLQGPAGNPTAIGATLTLTLADGSTQRGEVRAGGGYYSQSSPAVFFSYPAGALPRDLTVAWPDGTVTHHAFPSPPPTTLRLGAM